MNGYCRPRSVSEAVAILAANQGAMVIAGGTDLVIDRRLGRADAPSLRPGIPTWVAPATTAGSRWA